MPSKIQTKSGICITVRGFNPSSILFFDKAVRTIELTPEEALQVGSSLIRGVRTDVDPREQRKPTKTITICGSMKFLQEMREAKEILEKRGYTVRVPPLVDPKILKENSEDDKSFLVTKQEMMRRHIESIKDSDAILVLNHSRGDLVNYIGINTLLEIGAAFENGKAIFLLNEPSGNMEEIWALKPEIVNGFENLATKQF
jgi:hypothetical protein